METLDDELINKIKDSELCRVAFKEYKEVLYQKVEEQLIIVALLGGAGAFFIFVIWRSMSHLFTTGPFILLAGIGVFLFLRSLRFSVIGIQDLRSKELDIRADIFMDVEGMQGGEVLDFSEKVYRVNLVEEGSVLLLTKRFLNYKTGDEVYVVRTGFSKKLLDIIPKHKI